MDLNVLIIGGGIHGVGLLHDLSTRKISDVHLVEKNSIASGTSSRSTKLVHGGLRYLEHLNQWGLVHEALHERALLLRMLNGIVKPLPFVLPNFKNNKRSPMLIRMGLFFYDLLAGDGGLPSATSLKKEDILNYAPYLNPNKVHDEITSAFVYYDAQMLDDVIARIAAHASVKLGNSFEENAAVTEIIPIKDGFKVTIQTATEKKQLTTRQIVNATGAWCNANLIQWNIQPTVTCFLNLGTHIVFNPQVVPNADVNNSYATLLQEADGRVLFFIPWFGKWLFGTTESIFEGSPSHLHYPPQDKEYLLKAAKEVLNLKDMEKNIDEIFCGVRCMPIKQKIDFKSFQPQWKSDPFHSPFYTRTLDKNISAVSRETVIAESIPGVTSIYGGKYTTYRAISEKLGSMLSRRLNLGGSCGTHIPENWFLKQLLEERPEIFNSSKDLRKA
jgi:glycerol-3-phosphate dehydrogenase